MMDLLTKKATSGDLSINVAVRHLEKHEWGLARMAAEEGIAKGCLSEPDAAYTLLKDIYHYLGLDGSILYSDF